MQAALWSGFSKARRSAQGRESSLTASRPFGYTRRPADKRSRKETVRQKPGGLRCYMFFACYFAVPPWGLSSLRFLRVSIRSAVTIMISKT